VIPDTLAASMNIRDSLRLAVVASLFVSTGIAEAPPPYPVTVLPACIWTRNKAGDTNVDAFSVFVPMVLTTQVPGSPVHTVKRAIQIDFTSFRDCPTADEVCQSRGHGTTAQLDLDGLEGRLRLTPSDLMTSDLEKVTFAGKTVTFYDRYGPARYVVDFASGAVTYTSRWAADFFANGSARCNPTFRHAGNPATPP
jgi:hypothetical protein